MRHMATSSQSMMPFRLVEVNILLSANQFIPQVETCMNRTAGIAIAKSISSSHAFTPRCSLRGARLKLRLLKKSSCMSRLMAAARANIMVTQATPEKIC